MVHTGKVTYMGIDRKPKEEIEKVLIANRGEIAVRIIRACKELGIKTVAVYSEADETSRHVQEADEAYCIGPPSAMESYLNINNILQQAVAAQVDAVHPGYGFLSENPDFAQACERYGFRFIGPKAETMELMSKKVNARKAASDLGVPVGDGSAITVHNPAEAAKAVREIGYPVLIKPSAGGGGRGLRVAYNEGELKEGVEASQAEAQISFGDASLILEKYIEKASHVEVQILADHYGNVVHLGERDCSTQGRSQKLIEESPSPIIDEDMKREMLSAAVKLASGLDYRNAGTVEFIVDQNSGEFYFIEMNTRVQVEHPVTEMVTGIDIVKEQIRIASGKQLSFSQEDVVRKGWSIECRINAEDPYNNFFPCPGKITSYSVPQGEGVRVDDFLYSGYTVPFYYDSLLGKLIVWGKDREEAIKKMQKALDEYCIEGIKTTIPFHQRIMEHPLFKEGKVYTTFVQESLLGEEENLEFCEG